MMNAYIEKGEGWLEVENQLENCWGCFGHFGQLPKVVRSQFVEVKGSQEVKAWMCVNLDACAYAEFYSECGEIE